MLVKRQFCNQVSLGKYENKVKEATLRQDLSEPFTANGHGKSLAGDYCAAFPNPSDRSSPSSSSYLQEHLGNCRSRPVVLKGWPPYTESIRFRFPPKPTESAALRVQTSKLYKEAL